MSEGNFSFQEMKVKLEAFCAYQERCTSEILKKLYDWNATEEESIQLLHHLRENRFLDEERFALAYAQGKLRIKHWGRLKIRQGLQQKRISNELIQKAIYSLIDEEYESAIKKVAERKWGELAKEKDPWKRKMKVSNHLASKGYEMDLIFEVVGTLTSDASVNSDDLN